MTKDAMIARMEELKQTAYQRAKGVVLDIWDYLTEPEIAEWDRLKFKVKHG